MLALVRRQLLLDTLLKVVCWQRMSGSADGVLMRMLLRCRTSGAGTPPRSRCCATTTCCQLQPDMRRSRAAMAEKLATVRCSLSRKLGKGTCLVLAR